MQRAPRVGLEALTIARGTSALGPDVRISLNAGTGSYDFSPTEVFLPAFRQLRRRGTSHKLAGKQQHNHSSRFHDPALNVGLDPYRPAKHLAGFSIPGARRCSSAVALAMPPRCYSVYLFWNPSRQVSLNRHESHFPGY
jgi:hypothetical protein